MKKITLISCISLALCLGCSKPSAETTVPLENGGRMTMSDNGSEVKISGADGTTATIGGGDVKYVSSYVYPGSKLKEKGISVETPTEKAESAIYTTSDSFDAVCKHFESSLGTKDSMKLEVEGKQRAIYIKKEGTIAKSVTIIKESDTETRIEMLYADNKG